MIFRDFFFERRPQRLQEALGVFYSCAHEPQSGTPARSVRGPLPARRGWNGGGLAGSRHQARTRGCSQGSLRGPRRECGGALSLRSRGRLLAALNHPSIAALFDVLEFEGAPILVMEVVEGETLAERISRGAVPLKAALEVALPIAEALEAAHERGILHRDLKPSSLALAAEPGFARVSIYSTSLYRVHRLRHQEPGGGVVLQKPAQCRGALAEEPVHLADLLAVLGADLLDVGALCRRRAHQDPVELTEQILKALGKPRPLAPEGFSRRPRETVENPVQLLEVRLDTGLQSLGDLFLLGLESFLALLDLDLEVVEPAKGIVHRGAQVAELRRELVLRLEGSLGYRGCRVQLHHDGLFEHRRARRQTNAVIPGWNLRTERTEREKPSGPRLVAPRPRLFAGEVPDDPVHPRLFRDVLQRTQHGAARIEDLDLRRRVAFRGFPQMERNQGSVGGIGSAEGLIADSVSSGHHGESQGRANVEELLRSEALDRSRIVEDEKPATVCSEDEIVLSRMNQDFFHRTL